MPKRGDSIVLLKEHSPYPAGATLLVIDVDSTGKVGARRGKNGVSVTVPREDFGLRPKTVEQPPVEVMDNQTGTWFIAVSAGSWGRGRSIDEAKAILKKAGGNLKTYLVYRWDELEEAPWVDSYGSTVTKGTGADERKIVHAVKKGKVVPPPDDSVIG